MAILLTSNFQWVLLSTVLLGIASGMFGSFAYWKRQSLMSDAISHAALPGVVIAFLIIQEKNLLILLIGATISGLIGAFMIQGIRSSTRITEDTAMGMILAVFFGGGIMLLTMVNQSGGGNQAGLDQFIFGQAAAMVKSDVITMSILALLVIFVVVIGFKEWKLFLFDPNFAQGVGLSLKKMNAIYLCVLVVTIVMGIQAVGVILMSALIIIPPVSARYWTDHFRTMVWLSALFGGSSGVIGTTVSAFGSGWPTGPFIVLSLATFFLFSLFFGVKKGLLTEYFAWKSEKKLANENWSFAPVSKEGKG